MGYLESVAISQGRVSVVDFGDAIEALANKVNEQWEGIETEEATKNAFIMPFISTVLGYDVLNPAEVIPEFTADVGVKRGEKVDYAIKAGGEIQILIECKKSSVPLTLENASQLYRYFSVTPARIAVLTNGRFYNFYTDLDSPNKMDSKPFLVLDLLDIDETALPELKKLARSDFDVLSVVSSAEELKYVGAIKRELASEFRNPSPEFVRMFGSRVYDGRFTQGVQDKFASLVSKAVQQFLSERVNDRLKSALGSPEASLAVPIKEEDSMTETLQTDESGIETTDDELFAYRVVKAIACATVSPERVHYRDAKSYFAILLDDNNRKPIARCHFNQKTTKWIAIPDENKEMIRHDIDAPEDIYKFAGEINDAVQRMVDV
ncbi:MAG: type I restriction enzyme HsdR N-terminal domain-containing protein [Scrofimicrobium sp.]